MRRSTWLAPLLAIGLAAAPLCARLCEIRCDARAEHCHEATPQAPKGCPEKTHGADAPSLAAAKLSTHVTDAAVGLISAPPLVVAFAEPRFQSLAAASLPPRPDLFAPSALRL
ncbi:MAG TPA: hypothetical protein VGS00_09035 [Thermoanaerobaculia bacterium]|nr:hypothetical protein [Thermoanaerobaculia bacterium]